MPSKDAEDPAFLSRYGQVNPDQRQYHVLGIAVNPLPMMALVDAVAAMARTGRGGIVAHHNLHSIYLFHRDAAVRAFYSRASVTFIDGMPVIALARLIGYPAQRSERTTGVDWLPALLDRANVEGWGIFFLGGRPGVGSRACAELQRRYQNVRFASHHGELDGSAGTQAEIDLLAQIHDFRPTVLLVGMGMPKQEAWVLAHQSELDSCVTMTVGAVLDYFVGDIPTPPRWAGRVGLEWLYRLLSTPRRVAFRYLVEPWALVPHLVKDLVHRGRKRAEVKPSG